MGTDGAMLTALVLVLLVTLLMGGIGLNYRSRRRI
jgi:hypothetical protein